MMGDSANDVLVRLSYFQEDYNQVQGLYALPIGGVSRKMTPVRA